MCTLFSKKKQSQMLILLLINQIQPICFIDIHVKYENVSFEWDGIWCNQIAFKGYFLLSWTSNSSDRLLIPYTILFTKRKNRSLMRSFSRNTFKSYRASHFQVGYLYGWEDTFSLSKTVIANNFHRNHIQLQPKTKERKNEILYAIHKFVTFTIKRTSGTWC